MTWIFAAIGAIFGVVSARRRKGNRLDMLQYGAVYAIIFGILGLIVNLLLLRAGI